MTAQQEKEFDEKFHRDRTTKSGRHTYCKPCTKERFSNPEYTRKLYLKIKDYATRYSKSYYKKYPERYKAGYLLREEIRKGNIKRMSCEVCGRQKTQGHHDDYSKPLKVRWLCGKHHKLHHYKLTQNNP